VSRQSKRQPDLEILALGCKSPPVHHRFDKHAVRAYHYVIPGLAASVKAKQDSPKGEFWSFQTPFFAFQKIVIFAHMKFGSHVSSAGGLWNAPENAAKIGCEVFQFFSRPPQGGAGVKIDDELARKFREACEKFKQELWVIHAPYIINFASTDERIRRSSLRIIREELDRGSSLGARAVMFHPGSARDVDLMTGIKMVADGINELLDGYTRETQLLIEVSAGSGNVIGDTFDEVRDILKRVKRADVGVCFDTAHAFASGYDLRDAAAVKATFDVFDEEVGLDRLVMSHCNDSKVELGAKKDRHDTLGSGHIGLPGFEALLAEPRLKKLFWIVETPVENQESDIETLKNIRESL
jgi:deoxyribonuclease-4